MLIVMQKDASADQIAAVNEKIAAQGLTAHAIPGAQRVAIGITGNQIGLEPGLFSCLSGVADVIRVSQPYKLVSREVKPEDTVIDVGGVKIGGGHFCVMAGPCSVESREQVMRTAMHVREHGAHLLRGGAYKPRTSPYEFQGLKLEGLKLLAEAREKTGMPIITEVKDTATLAQVAEYADVLQIGARNMQNFSLLEALGEIKKPVMLKRGPSATVHEWLMAAEYIVARGNYQVILCERGIRTFETLTRNTLDLGVLPDPARNDPLADRRRSVPRHRSRDGRDAHGAGGGGHPRRRHHGRSASRPEDGAQRRAAERSRSRCSRP